VHGQGKILLRSASNGIEATLTLSQEDQAVLADGAVDKPGMHGEGWDEGGSFAWVGNTLGEHSLVVPNTQPDWLA